MHDSSKPYTITLDDDPVMHKIIAQITGIPSLPFSRPEKLIARAGSYMPLAVFIDIHLDVGVSGLEYLPALRRQWLFTPIFTITSDPQDELVGKSLVSGANDFIRKPLAAGELMGRLQARIIEMKGKQSAEETIIDDLVFNQRLGVLRRGENSVYLPRMEANILLYLAQNMGMTMSRDALRRWVWGDIVVSENALDKKISALRKAFKELGTRIQLRSTYGVGVALERPRRHESSEMEKAM